MVASAVLTSLPRRLNPNSYLVSCDLKRSHDGVGQGPTVASPFSPGDGNDPPLAHLTCSVGQ